MSYEPSFLITLVFAVTVQPGPASFSLWTTHGRLERAITFLLQEGMVLFENAHKNRLPINQLAYCIVSWEHDAPTVIRNGRLEFEAACCDCLNAPYVTDEFFCPAGCCYVGPKPSVCNAFTPLVKK